MKKLNDNLLLPISKEEFKQRFLSLVERYKKFLEYRIENNILFCSLYLDLHNVLIKANKTNSKMDYAKIIDKAEKTMSDLENIKNVVDTNERIIHNIMKQK